MLKKLHIYSCVLIFVLFTSCSTPLTSEIVTTDKSEKITQSEHFLIHYFEEDKNIVDNVLDTLENNFERITSILQVEFSAKSDVYIYPELETFHEAINYPQAPDWIVGVFFEEAIRIVSPNNPGPQHNYDSIMKVAVHEFVHLAMIQVNQGAPAYLGEGVATFLAEQNEGVLYKITFQFSKNN